MAGVRESSNATMEGHSNEMLTMDTVLDYMARKDTSPNQTAVTTGNLNATMENPNPTAGIANDQLGSEDVDVSSENSVNCAIVDNNCSDSNNSSTSKDEDALMCHSNKTKRLMWVQDADRSIYVPKFNYDVATNKDKFKTEDLLNDEMKSEVDSVKPSEEDILNQDVRSRDPLKCQKVMNEIFYKGRLFFSYVQLKQLLDRFGNHWAFSTARNGFSYRCHFTPDSLQSKRISISTNNTNENSNDRQCCEFVVKFRFTTMAKKSEVPSFMKEIIVTSDETNYLHQCQISAVSHRRAICSSGKLQPDVEKMKDLILLMRDCHLNNKILRTYIAPMVPSFQVLTDQWLRNFRRKTLKYTIDPSLIFNTQDFKKIYSSKNMAAEEDVVLDSTLKRSNFQEHLRQVLQDSGEGWNVIKLLEVTKNKIPLFDYRIWFDDDNKPIGVAWMTPEMRNRLLRYGDVLFLDAQKRQYNKQNWVYIGPVIIDNCLRVGTVIESLSIEETIESYTFVLKSLLDMEQRFDKSQFKLFFSDEFITNKLLINIGIQSSCILRSDQYHLVEDVWPKHFGAYVWSLIKAPMKEMLNAPTQDKFELAYHHARDLLCGNFQFQEYLDKIYANPTRYAGYVLKQIEGNLYRNGSSHAEQNHSSNISINICYYITQIKSGIIADNS